MPFDSYNKIFSRKERILVVMPHPDDTELYCGATVARLISDGKKVRVVKMTSGNRGSKQEKITSEKLQVIREREDKEALKVLGIRDDDNIYLRIPDGGIEHNLPTIGQVVYQIRAFRPELIFTTNPDDTIIRFDKDINWVNHRDHRHTGRIAVDAAYPYARDLLFFPEHFTTYAKTSNTVKRRTLREKCEEIQSWTCTEFLFTDVYDHPDLVYIDVTDYIDYRTRAHARHISQYSYKQAQESTDFFTKHSSFGKRRFERFRYVIAD